MDYERLNSFLHFGYEPGAHTGLPDVIVDSVSNDFNQSNRNFPEAVNTALEAAIEEEIESCNVDTHIVPLSGGLDSRAILSHLINCNGIDKSAIVTTTFGTPGTWDFEIGQLVASEAGVDNIAIDLSDTSFDWSVEALQKYAKTKNVACSMFDGYVNSRITSLVDGSFVVWSGFMGDPSAGGHYPENPSEDWNKACQYFIHHEQRTKELTHESYNPISVLPDTPWLDSAKLTFEEQLDFAIRQQCHIIPIVKHASEEVYKFPFMNKCWLSTILNIPTAYRTDRRLFKLALSSKFPNLFSLPTDDAHGLSPTAGKFRRKFKLARIELVRIFHEISRSNWVHPNTNYIDFEVALRADHELHKTSNELLERLSQREIIPWVDIDSIWSEHLNGKNRSDDILTLSSLELYLNEYYS